MILLNLKKYRYFSEFPGLWPIEHSSSINQARSEALTLERECNKNHSVLQKRRDAARRGWKSLPYSKVNVAKTQETMM